MSFFTIVYALNNFHYSYCFKLLQVSGTYTFYHTAHLVAPNTSRVEAKAQVISFPH